MTSRILLHSVTLLLLTGLLPLGADASSLQEKIQNSREKLEHLHENLGQIQAHLNAGQKTQAELRDEIKTLDLKIAATRKKLAGIQAQQQQTQIKLNNLKQKITALQAELIQQKEILGKQLRGAYMLGGTTPLAVWLQTEKPGELGRMSVYYASLAKARSALIVKTQNTAAQIVQTQHQVELREAGLVKLATQIQAQENTLNQQRQQHATLENQLTDRIAKDKAKIAELQANANILNGLVGRLVVQFRHQEAVAEAARRKAAAEAAARAAAQARAAAEARAAQQRRLAAEKRAEQRAAAVQKAEEQQRAEQVQRAAEKAAPPTTEMHPPHIATVPQKPVPAPVSPSTAPPPAPRPAPSPSISPPSTLIIGHGRYPAPVNGPITARYGSPRVTGGLDWQGITFQAAQGTPVRAIAPGMVLYAGPLRGYGQIVIVQIGHSLLSIYGHLGSTDAHVGEQIAAGHQVGTVGSGGELGNDGLYFEIRNAGHPVNPLDYIHN
ncbi:murein hydrolase activator EnvC family protein [Acidithiobacillus concretivorus]|uniref:Peptidoglycan DD-metalloendopeptidase family protein n=1 Tax=Acidithiobacillus concretivorus TaxID=3063952 RepID=A0ABS5ZT41_9PROT|nr:peptidoglycan DD-metalloendopeptidase family protein [Acidithiobacillus concretivorus]MBU2739337.1 peptidoglycan DD-metalloendopeptidase family protein [Acidithiobacillus concretivorus]